MKHASPLTLAALAVAGLASAPAMALEVYNNKGWSLDISGSVNAFYTTSKTEQSSRSSQIENGLLPGYFNITAATQQRGWDIKGVIGIWPGLDSDSPALASATAGVGKSTVDARTNYLSFGKPNVGTFKFGRDVGLFQSNAILNDMTLIGVGGGGGQARTSIPRWGALARVTSTPNSSRRSPTPRQSSTASPPPLVRLTIKTSMVPAKPDAMSAIRARPCMNSKTTPCRAKPGWAL